MFTKLIFIIAILSLGQTVKLRGSQHNLESLSFEKNHLKSDKSEVEFVRQNFIDENEDFFGEENTDNNFIDQVSFDEDFYDQEFNNENVIDNDIQEQDYFTDEEEVNFAGRKAVILDPSVSNILKYEQELNPKIKKDIPGAAPLEECSAILKEVKTVSAIPDKTKKAEPLKKIAKKFKSNAEVLTKSTELVAAQGDIAAIIAVSKANEETCNAALEQDASNADLKSAKAEFQKLIKIAEVKQTKVLEIAEVKQSKGTFKAGAYQYSDATFYDTSDEENSDYMDYFTDDEVYFNSYEYSEDV